MTFNEMNRYGKRNIIIGIIIAILFIMFMTSCDVLKSYAKDKDQSSGSTKTEEIIYRMGDTVHYEVPVYHFSDTVIYRKNEYGTTIKTVFDKSGNVSAVDCYASAIEEIRRSQTAFQNDLKNKVGQKETKANLDWVMYLIIGIVVIIVVALILAFIWLKQQSGLLRAVADRI